MASPGLGNWDEVWAIVEDPSDRLLTCLEDWERTGEEGDMIRAKLAAQEVLESWREAELRFQEAGALTAPKEAVHA